MTVAELIELLEGFSPEVKVKFSDDDGVTLYYDPMIHPFVDQEWGEVVIHVSEVET